MSRPRKTTTSDAPAATMIPFVPATRTPASRDSHAIEIALVMVRAPKPPGSRQLISPPRAVFEIAPAKVLHGAVLLQGLASSPTPETQVLVAWAKAGELSEYEGAEEDGRGKHQREQNSAHGSTSAVCRKCNDAIISKHRQSCNPGLTEYL
jgi:hypothetical protein